MQCLNFVQKYIPHTITSKTCNDVIIHILPYCKSAAFTFFKIDGKNMAIIYSIRLQP